jgi:HlyD family secretion protein
MRNSLRTCCHDARGVAQWLTGYLTFATVNRRIRSIDRVAGNGFAWRFKGMNPDKNTLDALRIDRSKAPKRTLPTGMIIGAIVAIALIAVVIWWLKRPKAAVVRTLVVQAASAGSDRTLLNGSGYVTARREATVSSKITGKVLEVLVEEGMKVEAGQVLARLDASNVEKSLQLSEAQAESSRKALNETRASLEQAERELRRVSQLVANKISSESDLDRAETEVKTLRARLERQQAEVAVADREVEVWKQQFDDHIIRAPFAGIVTSKNAQPGEMISPLSVGGFTRTGICTLVDMASLEIEVEVSESYINRVQPGQPVEAVLNAYPDWKVQSKVIAIIPTADRGKATVKVRVGFEKLDPKILPDMGVNVAFQRSGEKSTTAQAAITIPKSAVRQNGGRDVVWLVREGRLERRAVTVSNTQGDQVTISAGLNGGEKIVIEGAENVAEGATVRENKS